ncbi:MAG: N-acetyl-1-D-myo-inositol-2-amino-2-deoxy-alpha-D-glucopyranoside deacetylase [Nocardioidaceae bacterium]|nr:N-acetyl-1-D-myo-inositol-2-amino-2-deoxy-alpha-D-glucopyranoside deacetylase [Nocardioidaceae bacterium]
MSAASLSDRRMLLVHAHPDDESISNGASMAKYVAEGAHVTLVTCTLGEEGEVLVDSLAALASDRDDRLGEHRVGELKEALDVLGVTDSRFLGGAGRYRDTGMAYNDQGLAIAPPTIRDGTFWRADLTEVSNHLVEIIREIRPQVLVTYDESGGYGHPDHVQAHRVAMYAQVLAAVPSYRPDLGAFWDVPKVYWNAMSESRMRDGLRQLRDSGDMTTFEGMDPDGPLPPFAVPDEWLTTEIDANDYVDKKLAAMAAHATQITLDGPFFALSNNVGNSVWGTEFYRLAKGPVSPAGIGRERDLFAGVA